MLVRIRPKPGSLAEIVVRKRRRWALAAGALLTPASLMAGALAVWKLAAERDWADEFAIASGPFSRWQAWVAVALVCQLISRGLTRYGRGGKPLG